MKNNKIISFLPLIILLGFWTVGTFIVGQNTEVNKATAQQETPTVYDYSKCQYPFRSTNANGICDNSDPCDPANAVKGGSGDCVDPAPTPAPVVTPAPVQTNNSFKGACK